MPQQGLFIADIAMDTKHRKDKTMYKEMNKSYRKNWKSWFDPEETKFNVEDGVWWVDFGHNEEPLTQTIQSIIDAHTDSNTNVHKMDFAKMRPTDKINQIATPCGWMIWERFAPMPRYCVHCGAKLIWKGQDNE